MDSDTIRELLKFVNNSTAQSLVPEVRQVYYVERKRLHDVLTEELREAERSH